MEKIQLPKNTENKKTRGSHLTLANLEEIVDDIYSRWTKQYMDDWDWAEPVQIMCNSCGASYNADYAKFHDAKCQKEKQEAFEKQAAKAQLEQMLDNLKWTGQNAFGANYCYSYQNQSRFNHIS